MTNSKIQHFFITQHIQVGLPLHFTETVLETGQKLRYIYPLKSCKETKGKNLVTQRTELIKPFQMFK